MACYRKLGIILFALFLLAGAALPASAGDKKVATLAHIRLTGDLEEKPPDTDSLFAIASETFKTKLDRIKKAEKDSAIQGLFLQLDGVQIGWGKLNELRQAIADFRKGGKKAYAYLEAGSAMDYLLATACDEVCIPDAGWLMLTGIRGEVSFYKELLDKVGIKADMLQMGSYKGAAEPLTRTSMSPEFRERLESVLDDYYENGLIATIAESRPGKKLTPEQVKKLIDQGPYTAKAAHKVGLIDRVAYADEFRESLKSELNAEKVEISKNYGKKKSEEIDFSDIFSILKLFKPAKSSTSKGAKIAVIYASGVIVTGKSGESLFGEAIIGSTTMVEAIRTAEEDKTVKAIVLRVDSPGGSALASDLIWHELNKSKKPVVASMSDVAASGGYYISMAARKIYAEPGTLTGSIGVVGGKLVLGGLYDKIGVNTEIISRGANAGIFSSTTPFTESERKAMTTLMKDVYDQFLDKAIQGRDKAGKKFTRQDFLKYAEGRIWTGRQAKKHGLIDELGTLQDALAAAKEMAGMDKDAEPELLILPKPRSFIELLLESQSDTETKISSLKASPLPRLLPEISRHLRGAEGLLHLRGEPVWALMPCRVDVR